MSKEQKHFLKQQKLNKYIIILLQISILLLFIITWEYLSYKKIINPFIFSRPSKIIKCIYNLYEQNNLFIHIITTLKETIISFIIGIIISISLSIILYLNNFIYKVIDPYLTCLNSLPKVALGPIIIIICGANTKSIIVMSILINVIVSTITITNGFYNTDKLKIKLLKSFRANKLQLLKYLILPANYNTIISSLKLTISMSLIGVITGEFLVSKAGLGYLIIYGTQVFNLDLVTSGIILLIIISYILYIIVQKIEAKLIKK